MTNNMYARYPGVRGFVPIPEPKKERITEKTMANNEMKPCPFCGAKALQYGADVCCSNDACIAGQVAVDANKWNTRTKVETPERADSVNWGNFTSYLLDKCEGEIITEEFLQLALARMSIDPSYNTNAGVAITPPYEGPARYWLIEQPDLDDDDDYKVIHTTDLDCYPEALILGEYVRVDVQPVQTVDGLEKAIYYCREDWQHKDGYEVLYEQMDIIIEAASIQLQRQKGE